MPTSVSSVYVGYHISGKNKLGRRSCDSSESLSCMKHHQRRSVLAGAINKDVKYNFRLGLWKRKTSNETWSICFRHSLTWVTHISKLAWKIWFPIVCNGKDVFYRNCKKRYKGSIASLTSFKNLRNLILLGILWKIIQIAFNNRLLPKF